MTIVGEKYSSKVIVADKSRVILQLNLPSATLTFTIFGEFVSCSNAAYQLSCSASANIQSYTWAGLRPRIGGQSGGLQDGNPPVEFRGETPAGGSGRQSPAEAEEFL